MIFTNSFKKNLAMKIAFLAILLMAFALVFSCPRPIDPPSSSTTDPTPTTPTEPEVPAPEPAKFQVQFSVESGKGRLEVKAGAETITSGQEINKGTELTFEAFPEIGYAFGGWTKNSDPISGSTPTYSVAVNEALNVTVKFVDEFVAIEVLKLKKTLASASESAVTALSLTGVIAFNLDKNNPDAISNILKANSTKKVAIRLPDSIPGLTSMNESFNGCTSLVYLDHIPEGVTDMRSCFAGCTELVSAPTLPSTVKSLQDSFNGCSALRTASEIPASVTNLRGTFYNCTSLQPTVLIKCEDPNAINVAEAFKNVPFAHQANTIQVPATALEAYRAKAAEMLVDPSCFFSN